MHHLSAPLCAAMLGILALPSHAQVKTLTGFSVEQVYAVPQDRGSWVSLANDDKGRLIACDQRGKLYRITLGDETAVKPLDTPIGHAQGLLHAFGSLYVMGRKGKTSGLFRLRDPDGDDQYEEHEHLIQIRMGNEHHGHAIVLGPNGKSLYVCAGNMTHYPKPGFTSSRMPQVFAGDHVLARMPDAGGHNNNAPPIGGWVLRISPDASERELIANGFRNHYDIAFDENGELFTYDSDMEWDIGTPWYRPTRICHVVSGAEFGWRFGSGKWPAYFADSLPSVLDIGPGSPTGITFGTGARFPARYQKALFVADWSYGVIYAVHLDRDGASFRGTKEVVATAAPFPVTDMVVRPDDGALYFATGGRGASSALWRLRYTGDRDTTSAQPVAASAGRQSLRRRLETLHVAGAKNAIQTAWPHLGDDDRHVRFAARLAIEHQPVASWQQRVLDEKHPRRLVHGAIALARHGEKQLRQPLLDRLATVRWERSDDAQKLELLRAYGLVLARLDEDGKLGRNEYAELGARLDAHFPDSNREVNRELARLLSALDSDHAVAKTLDLLESAPSQEEQMHYAYCLRNVRTGWTDERRRRYLTWFHRAAGFRGGSSFRGFCNNIRKDAIKNMSKAEQAAFGTLVTEEPKPREIEAVASNRTFVKMWTVEELEPLLAQKRSGHDFENGRKMFGVAACVRCHRFAGEGGSIGPDLTSVGGRFGIREILESTIEPSKVISDQYQPTVFTLKDDRVVIGYVANYNKKRIKVAEDMFRPGDFTAIPVADIISKEPSTVSMMPPGLLATLTLKDVQDLVAFMRSGGQRDHALFR